MYKKWLATTIIIIVISLIVSAIAAFIIDPFMYYHKPYWKSGYEIPQTADRYMNAGISKNFEYDAVITGSSMTQSYLVSKIDEYFNTKCVKLGCSSARFKTIQTVLDNAFLYNDPKFVFWGIDTFAIIEKPDVFISYMPTYLYDNNPFNDIKYLLNKDVMLNCLKTVIRMSNKQENTSPDMAYNWYYDLTENDFTNNDWVKNYFDNVETSYLQNNKDTYLQNAQNNFMIHVKPFLESNPDTEFYFFFVPNSMVYWHGIYKAGNLDANLEAQKIFVSNLLEYDNVKVFYFSNIEEIICNYNNYADQSHHSMEVNNIIIRKMYLEENMLTIDNYESQIELLKTLVKNYDFKEIDYIN